MTKHRKKINLTDLFCKYFAKKCLSKEIAPLNQGSLNRFNLNFSFFPEHAKRLTDGILRIALIRYGSHPKLKLHLKAGKEYGKVE